MKWSATVTSAPAAAPLVADGRVLLALRSGPLTARTLAAGTELWTQPLAVDQPMDADGGRLFVVAAGMLHALTAADGKTVWQKPIGAPSAPIVARGGWVLVASDSSITALRASDGAQVWTRPVGAVSARPAIDGGVLYLPLTEGRLMALDLESGTVRWDQPIGPAPTEPFAYGDRVYVGSDAKRLMCLDARTGETAWNTYIGSRMIGAAAGDASHIYFVAMDNLLRALSRTNGGQRWKYPLTFRPSGGPVVIGRQVSVPGITSELAGLEASSGKLTGKLTFSEKLAVGPAFVSPGPGDAEAAVVSVTGGLTSQWTLATSVPAPPAPVTPPVVPIKDPQTDDR